MIRRQLEDFVEKVFVKETIKLMVRIWLLGSTFQHAAQNNQLSV